MSDEQRELKLSMIRGQRENKLKEVDIMVNALVLGKRSDTSAVSAYRDALLAITNAYKNEDGSASEACDAITITDSDLPLPMKPLIGITWPTAP